MPSLLPGYEYDIFISYRHNDNRSGWVSEFVNNLTEELSATIKEPLSIYFDSSPHDGLMETHDVAKSLEGKLKSLIFIPILSQTYCDPKSFAWQNEFLVFNKNFKNDQFGKDVKLGNGNVTSRILPVKIHELDPLDKALFEKEAGSVLRSVEFIFRSPGVNRSLRSRDDETVSRGQLLYRDQMNKTANAVKDLISVLVNGKTSNNYFNDAELSRNHEAKPEKHLSSIAVLPFANMSNDPEQEFFSHGIAEEIINSLASIRNLKVAGRMSSFQFNGKQGDLREVGHKLGVSTILEGSVRKQGTRLRITVQLINVEDGFHLWSEKYDREMTDIFAVQDEIAFTVTEKLKITILDNEREAISKNVTQSAEAYEIYLKGRFSLYKRLILLSIEQFQNAITLDPEFSKAYAGMADAYILASQYGLLPPRETLDLAKEAAEKAIALDSSLCEPYCSLGLYYTNLRNWSEAKKNFLKSIALNPKYSQSHVWFGHYYLAWIEGKFEEGKKHIEISIDLEPLGGGNGSMAGVLHSEGKYEEALIYTKKAVALDPQSYIQQRALGLTYLLLKQYDLANEWLESAAALSGRSFFSLVDLIFLYSSQGQKDKATLILNEMIKRSDEIKYVSSVFMAYAFGHLGQLDMAIKWLEKSYEDPAGAYIRYYPWVPVALRQHPAFERIIKKMNFPE